jgi:DNA processing protein
MEGGRVTVACDACLRRGALIGFLSPWIAARVGERGRPRRPASRLLTLPELELIAAVAPPPRSEAERLLEQFDPAAAREGLERARCACLCRHSSGYPASLVQLEDPPNPLYVRGGLDRLADLLAEPAVAIVGGRRPSDYARGVAREMGRQLAVAGVTVVSGLALGIDAESHRGVLAGGGRALAVLACGPDVPYPHRHRELYRGVLERGVVVSELPPGTTPRPWGFPARNRIMVGLSQMVVVVEARESSGSLITADFAAEAGRQVAAVPGQVTAAAAAGSNGLLRDGAAVVTGAGDVLDHVFGVGHNRLERAPAPMLEPQLRAVLDAVETRASLPSAALRTGLSPGGLRAALGRLETLGLIRRDGLGGYERSAAPAGRPNLCGR